MLFPARSFAEISTTRIAENYRSVCSAVGPHTGVIGVVKADAYGHGAAQIARTLLESGARWFAVSSVHEGAALRDALTAALSQTWPQTLPQAHTAEEETREGEDAPTPPLPRILVMAGIMPYEWQAVADYHLTPALHSLDEARELDEFTKSLAKPLPFHLKIDSGMGRMGTRAHAAQIVATLRTLHTARLEGLMSHLASAADLSSPQTAEQIQAFQSVLTAVHAGGLRPGFVHISSTNAIAYARVKRLSCGDARLLVRPGHAIYGYVSAPRGSGRLPVLKVAPALTWRARIAVIKDVPEGTPIGYGASYRAPHAMRIAVLAAGYADGIPHRLSNKGKVIAAGKLAPMVGTVSMDLTTIDISNAPNLRPGDTVTLLGKEGDVSLDAQQIARMAGTISYNVLCGIGARVKRYYV